MKKMTKLAAAIALASGAMSVQTSAVELSANAGFVTEYYFRGQELGDAGAYGGLDADLGGGFYAGTWFIDDGGNAAEDGLEVDFYVGWATEFENGISLDIAYNQYEYTYTSDYEDEFVLSVGFGMFSASYFDGEDNQEEGGTDYDYDGWTLGVSGEVFALTYGSYEVDESNDDTSYDWVEVSASGEVVGLDVTAVLGKSRANEDSTGSDLPSGDGYFFLDISKSFDL